MYRNEVIDAVNVYLEAESCKPLTILFVLDRTEVLGGFETHLATLITELVTKGYKIFIDCYVLKNLPVKRRILERIHVLENVPLENIISFIKDNKIDVIHGQSFASMERSCILSKKTGVPYVLTIHGPLINSSKKALQALDRASRIIAVSREVADLLAEIYPYTKNKTVVIENGVNTGVYRFSPCEKKTELLTLLFIGRLDRDRIDGLEKLISAYELAGYARLIICGDGNKSMSLRKKYKDTTIEFWGAVNNPAYLMGQADVVVATGRGCREAMSVGRPCIVLSSFGYEGIITPDNVTLLAHTNFSGRAGGPPANINLLFRDLKILQDYQVRKSLGLFGHYYVTRHCSSERMCLKTEQVYCQSIRSNVQPVISVILPVYNHAELLTGMVDSLLAQTFKEFELIIVNDGSTDNFNEVMQGYSDPRIRVIHNGKNMKLPYSINKGFIEARGKYFTWVSADNIACPKYLSTLVEALEEHPEYSAVYSDYQTIDTSGVPQKILSKGAYNLNGQVNFGPSFLYRRACVQKVGFFDEQLFGMEDRDYSIRMAIEGPVLWLPEVLYQYRVHDDSLTGRFINRKLSFKQTFINFRAKWGELLDSGGAGGTEVSEVHEDSWQRELILQPVQDFTVSTSPEQNINSGLAYIGSIGSTAFSYLAAFNLMDILERQALVSAMLELFIIRNDDRQYKTRIAVNPIMNAWGSEKELLALPQASRQDTANAAVTQPFSWLSIDVTSIVRHWLSGNLENHGLLLSPEKPEPSIVISAYNRHFYNKALRPRLRICVTGKERGKRYEIRKDS